MGDLGLTSIPVMETGMLIRKPVAEVFEAFVDPEITTQFWFTKSSGRLVAGHQVVWLWEMYGAAATVDVKTIETDHRIVIEWKGAAATETVEWRFTTLEEGTYVQIKASGFQGTGDEVVRQVTDSMQGFSLLLAGAKAYLEHNLRLQLVLDRYPKDFKAV